MQYDYGRYLFRIFLEKDVCDENIKFWESVQKYKSILNDETKRKALGFEIYADYVSPNAIKEINIDDESRRRAKSIIETGDMNAFSKAERHVYNLMEMDSYPKFLRSAIFKEFEDGLMEIEIEQLGTEVLKLWTNDFDALIEHHPGKNYPRKSSLNDQLI